MGSTFFVWRGVAESTDRPWTPTGATVFIGADGDDMGSHVAKYILANDIAAARHLSKLIHKGEAAIEKFARAAFGGEFVLAGGDDMLLQAPAARFDSQKVEKMRGLYNRVTGATITAGVGNDMVEASKALTVGKNTGKNKTVFWDPSMQEQYEKVVADKCNDLVTKCRSQGKSEAQIRDLALQLYRDHHLEESLGDALDRVRAMHHKQATKLHLGKAQSLRDKKAKLRHVQANMKAGGNVKLARRVRASRKLAGMKALKSMRKARAHAVSGVLTGKFKKPSPKPAKPRSSRGSKARLPKDNPFALQRHLPRLYPAPKRKRKVRVLKPEPEITKAKKPGAASGRAARNRLYRRARKKAVQHFTKQFPKWKPRR